MERLTKRLPSGAANYNYPASCYFDDNSSTDRIAQSAFRQRCVERLATYEDTGLEPEEVISMQGDWCAMMSVFTSIGSYNRLRELAEADKDGRLIIVDNTPCQVSPCDTCETGQGTITTTSHDSYFNHCEKLAEYKKQED